MENKIIEKGNMDIFFRLRRPISYATALAMVGSQIERYMFVFSMNQKDFHFPFIWDGFNLPMILIRITE